MDRASKILPMIALVIAVAACESRTLSRSLQSAESSRREVWSTPSGVKRAVRYQLVRVDDESLPVRADSVPNGCISHYLSGWYTISGEKWEAADTMSFTPECREYHLPSPGEVHHYAGQFTRAGDTLIFRSVSVWNNPFVYDRGLLRGDSLFTSGTLFDGPARVYIRR